MKLNELSQAERDVIRDLYFESMSESIDDEAIDTLLQMLNFYDIQFDEVIKEFED